MTQKVAVLGTGKIGEALLSGMIRAGWEPADLLVTARRPDRAAELTARHGVAAVGNAEAAQVRRHPDPRGQAAGHGRPAQRTRPARHRRTGWSSPPPPACPPRFFEERLADGIPVVRVMPNTPVLVDEGMSVISAGSHATEAHLVRTEEIFNPVGKTLRVPESQQDAATALSGSGPAYFYYLVEAMTDAGILLGLPRAQAHDLIVQSAIGAAVMLRDTGEHPVKLREAVTSPAGTTINAIRELENHGVRAALIAALEAARDRSRELASGNG